MKQLNLDTLKTVTGGTIGVGVGVKVGVGVSVGKSGKKHYC